MVRKLILPVIGLSIFGAFFFAPTTNAKPVEGPLRQTNQVLEDLSKQKEEKSTKLVQTTEEISSIEEKKATLAETIEAETKAIEELTRKLEEKKAAEARATEQTRAQATVASQSVAQSSTISVLRGSGGDNSYGWGQCTWYVKNRRPDIGSFWGNANAWVYSAQAAGYSIGSQPAAGAIGSMNGAMHVVYVESVNGDGTVNISEMNYAGGVGVVHYRTTPASEFTYIY